MSNERLYKCDCGRDVTFKEMVSDEHRACIVGVGKRQDAEARREDETVKIKKTIETYPPVEVEEPQQQVKPQDPMKWMVFGTLARILCLVITWFGCTTVSCVFFAIRESIGKWPSLMAVGFTLLTATVVSMFLDRFVRAYVTQKIGEGWFK